MPPTRSRQRDLSLLPRLRRQTTTMYGRPAGSAASSLSLFGLSIIQLLRFVLLDRSPSAERFFWPIPFLSPRLIEARKLLKIPQVIAPRLHFCRGKRRGSRAPRTGVTISNSFSSRPRRFHARPPKVERSVSTDGGYPPPFNRRVSRAVRIDFAGVRNAPRN